MASLAVIQERCADNLRGHSFIFGWLLLFHPLARCKTIISGIQSFQPKDDLNAGQMEKLSRQKTQILLFASGPAGTGKSLLIKQFRQLFDMAFQYTVFLTTTGSASKAILSLDQTEFKLSGNLKNIRSNLEGIQFIIIDEVRFVSNRVFFQIDLAPFGAADIMPRWNVEVVAIEEAYDVSKLLRWSSGQGAVFIDTENSYDHMPSRRNSTWRNDKTAMVQIADLETNQVALVRIHNASPQDRMAELLENVMKSRGIITWGDESVLGVKVRDIQLFGKDKVGLATQAALSINMVVSKGEQMSDWTLPKLGPEQDAILVGLCHMRIHPHETIREWSHNMTPIKTSLMKPGEGEKRFFERKSMEVRECSGTLDGSLDTSRLIAYELEREIARMEEQIRILIKRSEALEMLEFTQEIEEEIGGWTRVIDRLEKAVERKKKMLELSEVNEEEFESIMFDFLDVELEKSKRRLEHLNM